MPNPLDDAFAQVASKRAAKALTELEKERAAEAAARDLLKAYGEVLAAVPRYVSRVPEAITLAWLPETEPPSSVRPVGVGEDHRGSSFAFGTCDAWRFTKSNPEHKTGIEFFIAADCAAVFMIESFAGVRLKRKLRRAVSAERLEAFADVRTARHDLRLDVSPGYVGQPHSIHRCGLPSPEAVAKIIAEQELARRR